MRTPTSRVLWLAAAACFLAAAPVPAQESNAAAPASVPSASAQSPDVSATTNGTAASGDGSERSGPQQIVLMGRNAVLGAGETAEEVVVIGGSATIHGKVVHDAVVIGGTLDVDGEIGGDAVAVMGSVRLRPGAVAHRDAVAVLGNLTVAPGASVRHDAVSVLGKLDAPEGAVIHGQKVNVGVGIPWPNFEWLKRWVRYCVLEARPLTFQVGWIWWVAGAFLLLYFIVAALFPRPVEVCVEALDKRPATTFLLGLLTQLLAPVVIIVLVATGIGILVVPFVSIALFLAGVVGKVALREWIGLRIGRQFGGSTWNPLIAFLAGSLVIMLLYLVPILGGITFFIVGAWGLGCAVTATFGSLRRENPAGPPPPQSPVPPLPPGADPGPGFPPQDSPAAAAGFAPAGSSSPAHSEPAGSAGGAPVAPALAPPVTPPPVQTLLSSYPRAGFWERMGAAFLDVVIVGIIAAIAGGPLAFLVPILGHTSLGLVFAIAYFSGLWAWKGTTIGGIVLQLRVCRTDGSQLTFAVALVRALAAILSIVVLFLGFLWIAWDRDKQGWHDKIAGTEVIRLPRSVPLICA